MTAKSTWQPSRKRATPFGLTSLEDRVECHRFTRDDGAIVDVLAADFGERSA